MYTITVIPNAFHLNKHFSSFLSFFFHLKKYYLISLLKIYKVRNIYDSETSLCFRYYIKLLNTSINNYQISMVLTFTFSNHLLFLGNCDRGCTSGVIYECVLGASVDTCELQSSTAVSSQQYMAIFSNVECTINYKIHDATVKK